MAFFIKIVTLFKLHRHCLLFLLLPSRLNLIFPTVVVLLNLLLLLWYRLSPRIHPTRDAAQTSPISSIIVLPPPPPTPASHVVQASSVVPYGYPHESSYLPVGRYPHYHHPPNAPYPPLHHAYNHVQSDRESKVKVNYSSIHATFLATIRSTDALRDKKSWSKWYEGVFQAVADGFVLGHICDEPPPGQPRTKWNTPLYRPGLSVPPSEQEIEARLRWDQMDGWVSSILTARLSDEARGRLPPIIDERGERRTARMIYATLKAAYYVAPGRKACLKILDDLYNSGIHDMQIEKFNRQWSSALTILKNNGYDIPWDMVIAKYLSKFPKGLRYEYLCLTLEEELERSKELNRGLFDKFASRLERISSSETLATDDSGSRTSRKRRS
ncbi:hypothetical protein EV361DRAFT_1033058 [Lentinula raphanica]|nr:hypothetical protein EV361DRAFT_1033058 [Lentinula raphanica]